MQDDLRRIYARIRRAALRCDWEEVETTFERFCAAHADLIPQWFVTEYVFQAMRLWADGQVGQLLRHFANFVNRAAGAPLIDAVAEAGAVREAREAAPPPPPRRRPPRPTRPPIEELEPSPKRQATRSRGPRREVAAPSAPIVRQVVDVPQASDPAPTAAAEPGPPAADRPAKRRPAKRQPAEKQPAKKQPAKPARARRKA